LPAPEASAGEAAPGGFGLPGWLLPGRRPRRTARGRDLPASERYRLRYAKGESLRFTSHLDVTRILERALRRAQLPVARSRGKDPRPRIAWGPPLPLGMTSGAEVVDVTFTREIPDGALLVLDDLLPEGIRLTAHAPIRRDPASLCSAIEIADYEVSFPDSLIRSRLGAPTFDELRDRLERAVAAALAAPRLDVTKHRGEDPRVINARPSLREARVVRDDGGRPLLILRLALNRPDSVRPEALTAALCEGRDIDERLLRVHRSGLYIPGRNELLDPLDVVASGFAWWRQPVRGGTVL
jgi:radical SAM-linked protein